ncbi:hypothetical protein QTI05_24075 [Variovorax sp. J22R193]|uniref:hypothetical protein n=1 Tax=Variovorax fucosicus TaxID=3053517 RepID=UPI0025752369|nr:hypothetical protein [Variovorax sp. J22R193]MDM0042137.1 hypothetical protein [Variovorax sp. J22R193]
MNGTNKDAVIALGRTAKEWVDMLHTDRAVDAQKSLNYLDGQQEKEMKKVLSDPARGRAKWVEKGLSPRFRNVTKMIVEKSGLLFKDAPPVLEIFNKNATAPNKQLSEILAEYLSQVEFGEFCHNFDEVLRLLKTAIIFVQWDPEDKNWCFDILHRGNCEVVVNSLNRKVEGMIHSTGNNSYCIWLPDRCINLIANGELSVSVLSEEDNPFGVVPIAAFYDTNLPRTGFWVEQDKSLVNLNEMLNLHITDSEYSIMWSKMSTLFTNGHPTGAGTASESIEVREVANSPCPRIVPASAQTPSYLAGPGSAIVLHTEGGEQLYAEYKNPNIELKPLNEVMDSWIKGYAGDWCVRIEVSGQGRAQSGFQLVVEETDNLDLRKQRQRMMESGFKRLYRVLASVFNTSTGSTVFPTDAQLFAVFDDPVLPIDIQEQEVVWDMRIAGKRGTQVDYFMTLYGMSREEATKKFEEVIAFEKQYGDALAPKVAPTVVNNTVTPEANPAKDSTDK